MSFARAALAVIAGIIAAAVCMFLCEYAISSIYHIQHIDIGKKVEVDRAIMALPLPAFLLLLGSYAIASLAAGIIATLIARTYMRPAVICGILLTVGGIMNDFQVYHPTWFAIVNLLVYLPFAYVGYLLVRKKKVVTLIQPKDP